MKAQQAKQQNSTQNHLSGGASTGITQNPSTATPGLDRLNFSDTGRIVGLLQAEGNRWVIVADQAGRLRVESPSMFNGEGAAIVGTIDGQTVTRWSGAVEKSAASTGPAK